MLSRVPVAAIWAAALITLLELIRVGFTIPTVFAAGDGLKTALAVPGLVGAPLLLAGVLLTGAGRLGLSLARWGRPGQVVTPGRRVTWVLVAGIFAAGLALTLQPLTRQFWRMFRQKTYAGLAVGLSAVAFVALAAILAPAVVRLLTVAVDAISDRLPKPLDPRRGLGALVWTVLAFAICAWPLTWGVEALRSIDLGPLRLLAVWGIALVGFRLWRPGRRGRVAAVVVAGLMLVAVIPAAVAIDGATARQAVFRDLLVGRFSAPTLGRLADGDGDGAPRAFGGADCDDTERAVRPGAYDAPKDGIDQNCSGGDYLGADPLPRPKREKADPAARDLDVILVTVDALRHDVIDPLMPALKGLASESVVFENAYAHGAATYWSVPSMLASTLPSRLHMACSKTPENSTVMLPEVLQKAGFTTAMFTGTALFFRDGLKQGIKYPDFAASNRTGAGWKGPGGHGQTSDIFRFMEKGRGKSAKKLFLWSHYYDPHYPYFEIEGFEPADGSERAKYDAIVRYTDVQIGRLIQRLKDKGRWDRTVLVVTADHGEAFGEHGHRFHGRAVYDESVKVPLIIRVPGIAARRISEPIGLMDVSVTLLDLLGIDVPRQWLGQSWAAALSGGPAPSAPVFMEILPDSNYRNHMVGMRSGRFKLIHRVTTGRNELYDLAADPGELRNVFDTAPEAEALSVQLMPYVDHSIALLARNKAGTYLPPGAPKSRKRRCAP